MILAARSTRSLTGLGLEPEQPGVVVVPLGALESHDKRLAADGVVVEANAKEELVAWVAIRRDIRVAATFHEGLAISVQPVLQRVAITTRPGQPDVATSQVRVRRSVNGSSRATSGSSFSRTMPRSSP